MNLLLVASKYPPAYSGSGKRLHELYGRMAAKYGDVEWRVLSTSEAGVETGYHDGVFVHRVRGAGSLRLSAHGKIMRKVLELPYAAREFRASMRHLMQLDPKQYDLVHTCGWAWCVIAACVWARRHRVPLVRELTSFDDHPYSSSRWMRPWIRMTLRWSALIVAVSQHLADQCGLAGLSQKTWCRLNPIDGARFRPLPGHEKQSLRKSLFPDKDLASAKILLNVGRIRHLKSQHVLVRLMRLLPEDFVLVLLGPLSARHEDYFREIQHDIESFGLQERIIVRIGNDPFPERAMQAADLFVFPSVSEGLPNVVLESLMCGLPVVAREMKGITDTVITHGKNGFLTSFSEEEAVECIERAVQLVPARESIASAARERFGSDPIDSQYHRLLSEASRAKRFAPASGPDRISDKEAVE